MNTINIGTWNIKNSYFSLNKNDKKIEAIKELLIVNDLDVLALQEVNGVLLSKLEKDLGLCYYHLDRYLYNNYPIMPTVIEEHNITIIKDNFLNATEVFKLKNISKNTRISDIGGLRPRYVSKTFIKDEKDSKTVFNLYNTRLDSRNNNLDMQIDSLASVLNQNEENIPMVVVGNLNMMPSTFKMSKFKHRCLNNHNLKLANVDGKTHREYDEPIDYIIVPNEYEIEDARVISEIDSVSDHYPVLTKLFIR